MAMFLPLPAVAAAAGAGTAATGAGTAAAAAGAAEGAAGAAGAAGGGGIMRTLAGNLLSGLQFGGGPKGENVGSPEPSADSGPSGGGWAKS